jgi:hypothetical protein
MMRTAKRATQDGTYTVYLDEEARAGPENLNSEVSGVSA